MRSGRRGRAKAGPAGGPIEAGRDEGGRRAGDGRRSSGRLSVRLAVGLGAVALAAAAALGPTLFGRPWSIDHFYIRVTLETLLRRPELLSQLRVLEPYGIRWHDDDLDDYSTAFAREEMARARRQLEILRAYPIESQSPSQRRSTEVLVWLLETRLAGEPFLLHDYPLNAFDGVQASLPDFLLNVHQVRDARGARDYVKRLGKLDDALRQVEAGVRERAASGIVPPRFVLEDVRADLVRFQEGGAAANPLVTGFADALAGVEALDPEERASLAAGAARAVEQEVLPAYAALDALAGELLAVATDDAGAWKLPDGERYYAFALRSHTTTSLTADEIHEMGLLEVARIHGEMRAILDAEGIAAEPDLGTALRALHRDERFLFPDTEEGRSALLAGYQSIVDEAAARMPELFGRLPRAPVRVERVPAFREAGAAGAYYMPPPLDGSRPGIFYANLRSVREIPRFGMRTLAYHEAIPGHHLQIAIAQELPDLPLFRRVAPFTAYVEGWALYAEQLAAEQGFHPTRLDRLGQLVAEVFRAARLVVDTGLHARRWTREEAIDYMLRNTGMPATDIEAEVERYVVMPGQACAYKVGQLRLLALREEARAALGERFDLRAFHDRVLGQGALPLELLEQEIRAWMAAP